MLSDISTGHKVLMAVILNLDEYMTNIAKRALF